jgi:hypothetical protein
LAARLEALDTLQEKARLVAVCGLMAVAFMSLLAQRFLVRRALLSQEAHKQALEAAAALVAIGSQVLER